MRLVVTARDVALIRTLGELRAAPIEYVADRFFQENPFSGTRNADPRKACERRLATLFAARVLTRMVVVEGGMSRTLVALGPEAEAVIGRSARRAPPVRKLGHHMKTFDALRIVESQVRARGGRVKDIKVEQQVRAEAQRGRFLRSGDGFDPFPDAVVLADVPSPSGEMRRVSIALEYATSKYTDEDIRGKHDGFPRRGAFASGGDATDGYDEVMWFADRRATSERVRRITGSACTILE